MIKQKNIKQKNDVTLGMTLRTIAFLLLFVLVVSFIPVNTADSAVTTKAPNNLGLVGYWSFNEGRGATTTDLSGSNIHGKLFPGTAGTNTSSTTMWSAGKFGKALSFDGTDDYVPLHDIGSKIAGGNMTVSAWVKTADTSAWFLSFNSNTGGNRLLFGSGVKFNIYDGAQWNGTTTITDNKWHFVVGVLDDANNNVITYVDGKIDNQITSTVSILSTDFFSIGQEYDSIPAGASDFLSGTLDEVRVYNRALSASEVNDLYKNSSAAISKPPTNLGLVGYWSMNDGAGATTTDFSGNKNSGRLFPGTAGTNTASTSMWTNGRFGKGIKFDGTDDWVDLRDTSGLNAATKFTWVGWVYFDDLDAHSPGGYSANYEQTLFQRGSSGIFNGYLYLVLTSSNKIRLDIQDVVTNGHVTSDSSVSVVAGRWYHVAAVADTSEFSVYINGVGTPTSYNGLRPLMTAGTIVGNRTQLGSLDYTVASGPAGYLSGKMDDVRLYNRALSVGEIRDLYKKASETKANISQNNQLTNGLVGYWPFNGKDVDNTYVYDRSSNANHGYFSGVISTSTSLAIGKVGQGFVPDGVNDQVWIPALSNPASSVVTVSTWVKLKNHVNWYDLINNSWQAADGTWVLYTSNIPQLAFGVYKTSTQYNAAGCTSAFTLNEWHHVVGTYDGANARSYLDGTLCGTSPSVSTSLYTSGIVKIGENGSAGTLPFNMDEVRIYNRVLSASEIKRLYNLGR